jgi:protein-S-isoprenylcysteine O-methyltransferase Ste14
MSLIYSNAGAASAFWLTYLALTVLDGRLLIDSMSGSVARAAVPEQGFVHRPRRMAVLLVGEIAGLITAAVSAATLSSQWALLITGLTLAWAGLALRFAAKRELGRFFVGAVVIQEEHHVVATGPYAVIRHPGYAGSILSLFGLGLATGNALAIVIYTLVPLWVFLSTIADEEKALVTHLGTEYRDYSTRTSRLIPSVW